MNLENLTISEIWTNIEPILKENIEPYKHLDTIYELNLDGAIYQLHFKKGELTFYEEANKRAECTLKMSEKNFKKFLLGDLNSAMAFMTGQLKVEGNVGLALALEKIIKQYTFFDQ